jgi:hypothetical protein
MFYLSKDKAKVVDTFGDIVGYIIDGKFCQSAREEANIKKPDAPYMKGLSPRELEQISELMQRSK